MYSLHTDHTIFWCGGLPQKKTPHVTHGVRAMHLMEVVPVVEETPWKMSGYLYKEEWHFLLTTIFSTISGNSQRSWVLDFAYSCNVVEISFPCSRFDLTRLPSFKEDPLSCKGRELGADLFRQIALFFFVQLTIQVGDLLPRYGYGPGTDTNGRVGFDAAQEQHRLEVSC